MSIAIKVEHVSKYYKLGIINNGTLFRDMQTWWALKRGKQDPHSRIDEHKYDPTKEGFWALKDLDFEIHQGDRVGIIGKNGAGKSTLLKILSRITAPTEGKVKIRGRVASLLEVGTGFHGELTGRENIYLNGAILGMKRREVDRKIDEIIAFSEIEQHIDTPVKRYSSGMYVRLAFAVAAHLDSEILIADEVLAVGDASFQKKALGKMNDLSTGQGRTVLFVSHNMAAVQQLCNKGILLEKGTTVMDDEILLVIDRYLQTASGKNNFSKNHFELDDDKKLQLISARMVNSQNKAVSSFDCDYPICIELMIKNNNSDSGNYGYLQLSKNDGTVMLISDSNDLKKNSLDELKEGINKLIVKIPARTLGHGKYSVYVNFTDFTGNNIDSPGTVCSFSVVDIATNRGNNREGFFSTLLPWDITSEC